MCIAFGLTPQNRDLYPCLLPLKRHNPRNLQNRLFSPPGESRYSTLHARQRTPNAAIHLFHTSNFAEHNLGPFFPITTASLLWIRLLHLVLL